MDGSCVEDTKRVDANDYSRFENISDSDDDTSVQGDEESKKAIPLADALAKASAMKDSGNSSFKEDDLVAAREKYSQGIEALKSHEAVVSAAPDTLQLLLSLYGNMSMVALKQNDYNAAIKHANLVLAKEPENLKALFRRATACHRDGKYDEAKADLQRALQIDPENAAAKNELASVIRSEKAQLKKDKEAFGSLFSKGSMYGDREKELQVKKKKAEEDRLREEDEWTKSKLDRRSRGLDEQSFEDWKKEKEQEKKDRDAAATKAQDSSPAIPRPMKQKPKATASSDEEAAVYDEEDAKIIAETTKKGYCYFKNEQTQEVKELIGDIKPKVIALEESTVPSISGGGNLVSIDSTEKVAASSWNHAGTWEERDMSAYVKERLESICSQTVAESGRDKITVTSAKPEGDAQIILSRGKKRHVYDFKAVLEVEVSIDSEDVTTSKPKKLKATITFAELSPVSGFESSVSFKKAIVPELKSRVDSLISIFSERLVEQFQSFNNEYKQL